MITQAETMARAHQTSIFQRVEGLPIIFVFAVLLAIFMYLAPEVFLRPFQYTTFLSTLPPVILLAIGLTFIIGAGEIDLCFPAILGFSGFVFAVIFKEGHTFVMTTFGASEGDWLASTFVSEVIAWAGVILAIASGVLVGFINGVLVAKIGIPSFIATLGTQFFWYGMATVLSGGKSYALRGAEESSVWRALVGRPFASSSVDWVQQLPIQSLWTALVVILMWFILTRHRFGEHTLFIGDSNDVSRVVGIDVDREKIKLFTLMGALAALAAIFLTLENKNYFGNQGQGYLLIAIASVLIGGTSIFGGRATIVGTVFGCFIIAMVEPGLVATGLSGAWVNTVRGLIFLVAIVFYLNVDEPQRRSAFFARVWGPQSFGRIKSVEEGAAASAGEREGGAR
jgi:simple sugar transport system permease protein